MLTVPFVPQLCALQCPNTSALSAGVGAMTWSPLACGIISGKYGNGVPESSRAALKVFFHLLQCCCCQGWQMPRKGSPVAARHGRARFLWPRGWQQVGAGHGLSSHLWAPGCSWPAPEAVLLLHPVSLRWLTLFSGLENTYLEVSAHQLKGKAQSALTC